MNLPTEIRTARRISTTPRELAVAEVASEGCDSMASMPARLTGSSQIGQLNENCRRLRAPPRTLSRVMRPSRRGTTVREASPMDARRLAPCSVRGLSGEGLEARYAYRRSSVGSQRKELVRSRLFHGWNRAFCKHSSSETRRRDFPGLPVPVLPSAGPPLSDPRSVGARDPTSTQGRALHDVLASLAYFVAHEGGPQRGGIAATLCGGLKLSPCIVRKKR